MVEKDREEILALYAPLRVSDVRDGMDWNMMHHYGSVSRTIRPVYRTRVVGIARTARYVPYGGPVPTMTGEEYTAWVSWYYREVCHDPWQNDIEPGDIVVIDQAEVDCGVLGSNNTLAGFAKGARGYVTNGGVRDTDEIILERVPVWSNFISQKMDQGRVRFEAKDVKIQLGGVSVDPGDIVVADGDGVIVVPRKLARNVAKYAHQELAKDKVARRKLYLSLGRELDDSVN